MSGNVHPAKDPAAERMAAHLVGALRVLEETRETNRPVPTHVLRFLGALDRALSDEERCYVAMAFAARKEMRDELARALVERLGIGPAAVIAGMRAHLQPSLADGLAAIPRRICGHLEALRASVLMKVALVA